MIINTQNGLSVEIKRIFDFIEIKVSNDYAINLAISAKTIWSAIWKNGM